MQVEYTDFAAVSRIRCVLLPVGLISAQKFNFFASFIEQHCAVVNLCDVTKNPADKTLLQHQKWRETKIRFSFRRAPVEASAKGLSVREELYSDLENFQAHKKIVCAIGILHCPLSVDIKAEYEEWTKMLKLRYATATVLRCFAMEKNPAEEPVSGCPDLMEIPVCDEAKTRFYFSTLMQDFTYAVLRSFEVQLARKVEPPFITTPFDVDLTEKQLRAVQLGRLNKTKADYCMLAGSPQDALIFYEAAKVECRRQSDTVWLGGAQDGYCSAMLAMDGKDEAEAMNVFQEALANYSKGKALALEIEAYLKLARWNRERKDFFEATNLLMTCHALGQSLSAQNKVVLLTGCCHEFQQMAFYRKFAFFLRELAVLYEQLQMHATRERVLLLAAPFFQLHELGPKLTQEQDRGRNLHECLVSQRNGWDLLSALTLLELAKVAEARDDSFSYARYITYMLRLFPGTTSAKTQKDLANLLMSHTRRLLPCLTLDMCGLPLVKAMRPLPARFVQVRGSTETPGGQGVFIFNPAAAAASSSKGSQWEETVWVQGEVASVRVSLKNDREFNIHVERICLLTEGAPFESFSASFNVPAKTTRTIDLSGIPIVTPGQSLEQPYLALVGVEIQAFHIIGVHHVDAFGRALFESGSDQFHSERRRRVEPFQVQGPMRIKVAGPLPVLLVESALFNGNHLQILEGVDSSAVIMFENCGQIPVAWIKLTVQENMSAKPGLFAARSTVFSWGKDSKCPVNLLSDGPKTLKPGERFSLSLNVYGLVGTIGASFLIEYGASSPEMDEHFRSEIHHIPIFVHKGLELTSLRVELSNYSASEICRALRIRNASYLHDHDSVCLLMFQIGNSAKTAFSLNIQVNGVPFISDDDDFLCSPGASRLLVLPIARVWLPEDELEEIPVPKGQFIKAKEDLTPLQLHARKLQYNYKKYLQRLIQLKWSCPNNQSGTLSMHDVNVDMSAVRKILPAPIHYGFCSGKQVLQGLWHLEASVFRITRLEFSLQNKTQAPLDNKIFRLKLLDQDLDELLHAEFLSISHRLEFEASLESSQEIRHCFQVALLVPGEYRFQLLCINDDDLNHFCINPVVKIEAIQKTD